MLEVVIPAYKAARFLRETLASVLAQSHLPDLVTVVDDRSTDNTVLVALACAAEFGDDLHIRVLRNAGARGPSAARNMAIQQSQADFIALLDADDKLRPDHHQRLLNAIGAGADIVASFGDSTRFGPLGIECASLLAKSGMSALPAVELGPNTYSPRDGMFAPLLQTGVFDTSACMLRRNAVMTAGLFDEELRYGEDTDLFLRLALAGRFAFTRAIVADKRRHDTNLTQESNTIAFCRAKVVTLMKFYAESEKFALTAAQRDAVDAELTRAIDDYAYYASKEGVASYSDALRLARGANQSGVALKPRHLTRMMLLGIGGGKASAG